MSPEETTAKLTRAGLNLIQQALSIYDRDLRLAVCNRPFQEMFGLPEALVTPGASFEDTIRYLVGCGEYGTLEDVEEAVRARVEQARAFRPHYMERTRANGRTISVEGSPLPQGGWVAVYTDITEIKRQEALLRARSEELSEQVLANAERLAQANRDCPAPLMMTHCVGEGIAREPVKCPLLVTFCYEVRENLRVLSLASKPSGDTSRQQYVAGKLIGHHLS